MSTLRLTVLVLIVLLLVLASSTNSAGTDALTSEQGITATRTVRLRSMSPPGQWKCLLPLLLRSHPPSPTATPTATIEPPTPTPTLEATPISPCPQVGHWTGTESQAGYDVSFDVTSNCAVHRFAFRFPFVGTSCYMRSSEDLHIENGRFRQEWEFWDYVSSFSGEFHSSTHSSGSYSVYYCDRTLQFQPSEGTWEANWSGPAGH